MRLGVLLLLKFFQTDLIAQRLQATHGGVALVGGVQGVEGVRTQIVVVLVGTQQLVDDHEQTVTDRHDGTLFPNATR
jgi:hypothetical protein